MRAAAYFTADEARARIAVQLHEERPGTLDRQVDSARTPGAGFPPPIWLRRTLQLNEVCQVQSEPHAAHAEYTRAAEDDVRPRPGGRTTSPAGSPRTLGMEQVRHPGSKPHVGGGSAAAPRRFNASCVARAAGPQGAGTAAWCLTGRTLSLIAGARRPRSTEDRQRRGENHRRRVRIGARAGGYSGYGMSRSSTTARCCSRSTISTTSSTRASGC